MYDTHMHTKPFSADGKMVISEVLKRQEETGLGIVLTEHMDYDFPSEEIYEFDGKTYFEKYAAFHNEQFLLGAEVGLRKSAVERNKKFVKSVPFDMVIGSTHVVDGEDLYMLSFFQRFLDKRSAFTAYLDTMYENIQEFDDFDTLAHMDYICRNAPYADPFLHYTEYAEQIDRILALLADRDQSLEINTRLFAYPEAVREWNVICRRFAELHGRTVTIGSDAHRASDIGKYMEQAYILAFQCGLMPVVYRERKAFSVSEHTVSSEG